MGSSNVDVLRSSTLHSFNVVVSQDECGFESMELRDVISQDDEDPDVWASRKLDWQALMQTITNLKRRLANLDGLA